VLLFMWLNVLEEKIWVSYLQNFASKFEWTQML
jgi:hypothetical protein